jgi:intracellular sulfur oxidation DsrE/DsrF family protein
MDRRNLLSAAAVAFGGLFGASAAKAATPAGTPDKSKVVYHLNELDKVSFVLGNIGNHYEGAGGPDKVSIVLVVHGPALKAFHAATAKPDLKEKLQKFSKLELAACGNTIKSQNITVADLMPGFVKLDQGGVVRIAELQAQGYVYLRP